MTNQYQEQVKEHKHLPRYTFPGFYPIYYITPNGDCLCSDCAAKRPEDISTHDVHWEGAPMRCEDCNEEIKSAYGDPALVED